MQFPMYADLLNRSQSHLPSPAVLLAAGQHWHEPAVAVLACARSAEVSAVALAHSVADDR